MTHFHIVTLFPDALAAYTDASILGRAQRDGAIAVSYYNPRDYTDDPHRRVDRRPYGGGPGMVLAAEPILRAAADAAGRKRSVKYIVFSAQGRQFDSGYAESLARTYRHIVLIAGHYEGVDARVADILGADEISIGPYVLTGGELPAAVLADTTARFVPGVLGNDASLEGGRIASPDVYTRPEHLTWKGKTYSVPDVLRSGHHADIEAWKRKRSGKKK